MSSTKFLLEKLSREQEQLMLEHRDEWIRIGLSTAPADRRRAEAAITAIYGAIKRPRPIYVLLGSPMSCQVGLALLRSQVRSQVWSQVESQVWSQVRSQVRSQVESQVGSQVWSQVESQVWSQVESQVGSQVGSQVRSQVRSQVWSQVGSQVRSQVESQVGSQVWSQVESQVRSQVESQVWSQVGSQVWSQVWSQVGSQVWSQVGMRWNGDWFWGQWEAGWLSYYDFFPRVGVQYDEVASKLAWWIELAKSCGWWWPTEQFVVISERPSKIARDTQTRLHDETGPAVLFPDGYGVYAYHGVLVPFDVIEAPEKLKVERIAKEPNMEVRRVMLERFGADRYLRESGSKKLGTDDWGTLWRADLSGDEPLVMVEVLNSTPEPDGSFKTYFLRVPPATKTAREGVAWTFDVPENEYAPEVQT